MLENEVASKVNLQKKVYHARFACGLVFICNVIGAIISIFILTIDFSQLYRAFLMSSSSSLWSSSLKRYCFGSLPRLSSALQRQQAAVFNENPLKSYLPTTKRQADKTRGQVVNIMEHSAANGSAVAEL